MSDPYRRAAFLQEMGLGPIWASRHGSAIAATAPTEEVSAQQDRVPESVEAAEDVTAFSGIPIQAFDEADVGRAHENGGIDSEPANASEQPVARMDWTQLRATVSDCRLCGLCHNRTQTVFGTGDIKARWLFVGEGPGRNEDFQGEPFVGPAGKLLDNMLLAMKLKRGDNAYIANIVKCRPTDANRRDRPPTLEEVQACMPYLERQIALINPTVIVALGKTAALSLLKLDPATPVSRLRGTVHRHGDTPLIVTYHPAYLLRNLRDKGKVWADMCLAMQTFAARD